MRGGPPDRVAEISEAKVRATIEKQAVKKAAGDDGWAVIEIRR